MSATAEVKRRDYTGLIIGVILMPVVLFFIWVGKEDIGRSAAICLGALLLAVRIRWDLRKCAWFWAILVFLLLLHLPLFFLIRWPTGFFYHKGMLPLALIDLVAFLGAVHLVEKFIVKSSSPDEQE
jgi:hypothetical protein